MFLQFDDSRAEELYHEEGLGSRSPEDIYERTWALALLDQVLRRLGEETSASGQAARLEQLKPVLIGERPSFSYAELANRLGTTAALRNHLVSRQSRGLAALRGHSPQGRATLVEHSGGIAV